MHYPTHSDSNCPQSWTDSHPALSRVRRLTLQGWQHPRKVHPYEQLKMELGVQDGCVLWGTQVVELACHLLMHTPNS